MNWNHKIIFHSILAIIVIILLWTTLSRNILWDNEISLWRDVIQKSPEKERGYLGLGNALMRKGSLVSAINMFNQAVRINPYYQEAYKSRGTSYMLLGEKKAAEEDFKIYELLKKQRPRRKDIFSEK